MSNLLYNAYVFVESSSCKNEYESSYKYYLRNKSTITKIGNPISNLLSGKTRLSSPIAICTC